MQFQHFQHMSSQVKQMKDKYIVHASSFKKKPTQISININNNIKYILVLLLLEINGINIGSMRIYIDVNLEKCRLKKIFSLTWQIIFNM